MTTETCPGINATHADQRLVCVVCDRIEEEWEVENGAVYERAVTTRYTVEVNGETRGGRHGLVALVYERHGEHATNGRRAQLIAVAPELARLLHRLADAADAAVEELHALHAHYLPTCGGGCPSATIAAALTQGAEDARSILRPLSPS